jgi:hypothetical protein
VVLAAVVTAVLLQPVALADVVALLLLLAAAAASGRVLPTTLCSLLSGRRPKFSKEILAQVWLLTSTAWLWCCSKSCAHR